MKRKIYSLEKLKDVISKLKSKNKVVVHCHGCFDLLHHGHIKHFEAAKKYGDILVVTVTEDNFVNKGPDRPYFNENIRAENIAALECVDFVAINRASNAVPAINSIKPNFYVKGQDYKISEEDISGGILIEKNAVESHNGNLIFTEEVQYSSSTLINEFLNQKDDKAQAFIKKIKTKFDFEHFVNLFEKISDQKVLIVGDVIIDEYQFVKPIGKASKSSSITAIKEESEFYAGGVLAVANHVADFVKEVHLLITIGHNKERTFTDFIKKSVHPKVKLHIVHTPERPTVLKTRLVDKVFKHKLFEVIEINDTPLSEKISIEITEKINQLSHKVKEVIVADFGHGMIDKNIASTLSELDTHLSVNTQTNSSNLGYNLLTKFPRCDYFSIDKEEAHLALSNKFGSILDIQTSLMEINKASLSSITMGVNGTSVMNNKKERVQASVFNHEVLDTIGAGDAYLSITSLLAYQKCTLEEIAFIGNAVGAMAVKILGNKSFIKRTDLLKYVKTLLA